MQQLSLFATSSADPPIPKIDLAELFTAYFACRKNKRNTINALAFELDYEHNLIALQHEINEGRYSPGRSIAFIVNKPVKREIFAASFRDRVVHHWIIGKLNPLFEKVFIHDSYACRENKGTHFGIQRINKFIRQCSQNDTAESYYLKLDIQSFFMDIDKRILWNKLSTFIHERYLVNDKELLLALCEKIIFNEAPRNCIIKGHSSNWHHLPANKSLFNSRPYCGLPIGNLTSQIFANFYMNNFDHFMKHTLGLRFYGRYVDDFIVIHKDKEYLKWVLSQIKRFLFEELRLTLHPRKISLQHYAHGVSFLGVIIKPHRIYMGSRIKGNFYNAIFKQNEILGQDDPSKIEKQRFLSSMNSYLGMMQHYTSYYLRKNMLRRYIDNRWWEYFYVDSVLTKIIFSNKKKPYGKKFAKIYA